MKNSIAFFRFVFMGIFVFFCLGGCDSIKGNGNIIITEETLPAFDKIYINQRGSRLTGTMGKGIIRFHSDPGYRAVVTVDSNISQYVKLESRGNTLRIETLRKISTDYTVDVYAPSLSDLTINGMGHVKLIDTMTVPSFRMDVSGYGKLEGTIECDKFSTKIAGAGEIKIAGTGEEADINVFGAGTFEGREFKIGKAHISIEGAGNVKTWVVDTLKAEISGVGNIKYRGDPKIEFSRGGLGNLSRE